MLTDNDIIDGLADYFRWLDDQQGEISPTEITALSMRAESGNTRRARHHSRGLVLALSGALIAVTVGAIALVNGFGDNRSEEEVPPVAPGPESTGPDQDVAEPPIASGPAVPPPGESESTSAGVSAPPMTNASTSVAASVDDPWLIAVTNAQYPIAVAYGLPDDQAVASRLLERSYERKRGACMQRAGFDYRPELAEDAAAPLHNSTTQTALPLEERVRYNTAYDSCSGEAAAHTYLVSAVCGTSLGCVNPQGAVPATPADQRQAEIDFIISHRETIETLVASLDYT